MDSALGNQPDSGPVGLTLAQAGTSGLYTQISGIFGTTFRFGANAGWQQATVNNPITAALLATKSWRICFSLKADPSNYSSTPGVVFYAGDPAAPDNGQGTVIQILALSDGSLHTRWNAGSYSGTMTDLPQSTGPYFNATTWTRYCFRKFYTASVPTLELYANGTLVNSWSGFADPWAGAAAGGTVVNIGRGVASAWHFTNGAIDEIQVFNTAGTSAEAIAYATPVASSVAVTSADFSTSTSGTILVKFSANVNSLDAATTTNYSIPGLTVTGASYNSTTFTTTLTVTGYSFGTSYTLTVLGMKDASSGTIVSPKDSVAFINGISADRSTAIIQPTEIASFSSTPVTWLMNDTPLGSGAGGSTRHQGSKFNPGTN
jgi:hypothetical protein